jgi:hypothetical protein
MAQPNDGRFNIYFRGPETRQGGAVYAEEEETNDKQHQHKHTNTNTSTPSSP